MEMGKKFKFANSLPFGPKKTSNFRNNLVNFLCAIENFSPAQSEVIFSHHHFPCSVFTKLSSKTFSKHSHRMLEGMVSNLGRRCVMLTTLRQPRIAGFDTVGGVGDEAATLVFLRHNMWSFTFFRLKNYIFQITT